MGYLQANLHFFLVATKQADDFKMYKFNILVIKRQKNIHTQKPSAVSSFFLAGFFLVLAAGAPGLAASLAFLRAGS